MTWTRLHLMTTLLAWVAYAQVPDAGTLTPGASVNRRIEAGQVHTYRLAVLPGQFVRITAAQMDSDIAIRLVQPDGKPYTNVDRLRYGSVEDLPWISTTAGDCTIEVRAAKESKAGPYRLDVVVRTPTGRDRSLVAGFIAGWIEGQALRRKWVPAPMREAVAKYDFAASEFRRAGDTRWEAYALSECAWILDGLDEYVKARERAQQAVALRRTLDEPLGLSVSLNSLGRVMNALGDTQRAIEAFREALEIRRRAGDRLGAGRVLTNLGGAYTRISEFEKAIEAHTEALAIQRQVGDTGWEVTTLSLLANVHNLSGDLQAALERRLEAWKLVAGKGDKLGEGRMALSLGAAYFALGNHDLARHYYSQAEALAREMGDAPGLASALHRKGRDQALQGKHANAVASFEEGLALRRKVSTPMPAANDLAMLCASLLASGKPDKARERGSEGLQLSRDIQHNEGVGLALVCLGRVKLAEGDHEGARAQLAEARDLFRAMNTREHEVNALTGLAEAERARGNLAESLRHIERATELIEAGRAPINDPNLRASYRATRAGRVDFQTSLLMDLHGQAGEVGYGERAFNVAEGWRARSLTEMVLETRDDLRQELTTAQRQREDRLLFTISTIQRELFRDGVPGARQQELQQQLSTAERELDLFQAELRSGGNRYAAGQYAETWDAKRIRHEMLDAETALVEYALGEQQSYAWAVTKAGVWSTVLPGRSEIERRVEAYRRLLGERVSALTAATALARTDAEGRKLYQMLVAPLEVALGSKKRLIIVPDGALAYVPFEALPGPSHLIERFSISYAPSASALAALRDRERRRASPGRTLLALADPALAGATNPSPELAAYQERGFSFTRLPNARAEVAGIRSLYAPGSSRVYLGDEAREQVVKAEKLEDYRYVHFAAHGYFDEDQPSRSGIVLSRGSDSSNDGFLQSREIMRLRLNADIVTLSACQTGLGKLLAGEGVMGLSRAFFYAGTQSLVVSLWSVNDAATAELMKRFYANLKTGMARDEALRQAKLALRKASRSAWRHPYYWAPFVFLGDPGVARLSPPN